MQARLNMAERKQARTKFKAAADALMDMVECSAERAVVATEGLLDVIQDIALPETQPSLGGGGSSNNDLPEHDIKGNLKLMPQWIQKLLNELLSRI